MVAVSFILLCLVASFLSSAANIVEPATKHVYMPEDSDKLTLAGVGVRVKKIGPVKVNVYSAAVYVDKSKAIRSLSAFKQSLSTKLRESTDFSNILSSGPFTKAIVLKMARDVASETMVEALAESVKPRIGNDASALKQFQSILSEGLKSSGAKKSMELKFRSSDNQLSVAIDGKLQGVVKSSALCTALLNVYVDKNTVSPPLADSICQNAASWLA